MGLWGFLNKPILPFKPGYEFLWHEPRFLRLQLHRDLGSRLLMGIACTAAIASIMYVAALAEHDRGVLLGQPTVGIVFGVCLGLVVTVAIILAPESILGSVVKVKDKEIYRVRETLGVHVHAEMIRERWEYAGLPCAVVPGEALGTKHTVLALPDPENPKKRLSFIAVPPHVDLDAVLRYLAERGAKVWLAPELAARVRAQRPYSPLVVKCVVAVAATVAVFFMGYAVRVNWLRGPAPLQPPAARGARPAIAPALGGGGAEKPPKPKNLLREFSVPDGQGIEVIALSEDGRRLLAGTSRGKVLVFGDDRDAPVAEHSLHKLAVQMLALSPDGATAFSAETRQGQVWDVATGQEIARFDSVSRFPAPAAFSPDGRYVFFPDAEGAVCVYEVGAKRQRLRLKGGSPYVRALAATADGTRLVAVDSREIHFWELQDGRSDQAIRMSDVGVYSHFALPREGRGIFASISGTVVWDLSKHEPAANVAIPAGAGCVAVSGDGRTGFMAADGEIAVWDLQRGVETARLPVDTLGLKQISASADGRRIATCNYLTHRLHLWEPERP